MILKSNKKILLISGIIVILAIVVYLCYKIFMSDKKLTNTEKFAAIDNYAPVNLGDPLSNNLTDDVIVKAQNNIYNLNRNYQIINFKSNIAGTTFIAACNDSSNGNNLAICVFNITNNKWECLQFDIGANKNLVAFNKLNPSTTLPEMNNNISCAKDSSILITNNSKTLFIYNEPYNLQKRLNCLYYSSTSKTPNTNTMTLNCLALPSINKPSTTLSNGDRAPLSYDKMNFICANERVLLGLSCTNILQYVILDIAANALSNDLSWKYLAVSVSSIPNFNLKNVIYLGLNDYAIFIYYNDFTNPATLLYSPLNISGGVLTISLEVLSVNKYTPNNTTSAGATTTTTGATTTTTGAITTQPLQISSFYNSPLTPNFYSNGFAINNNVIFGLERQDKSRNMNLWWCSLNNGLPSKVPNWNNINLSNQGIDNIPFYNLTSMCIFNNSLIINYYTSRQNNFVIPLLSDNKQTTTTNPNTITTNPNTITTNPNTITTNPNTITTNPNTITTNPNTITTNSNTITTNPNTITTNPNIRTTNPNIRTTNPNTTTKANRLSSLGSVGGDSRGSGSVGVESGGDSRGSGSVSVESGGLLSALRTEAQNGIRTDVGINGVNGNLGNYDNINDFMKDATLLGNNIYVSPMNNDQLYNPQSKLSQLGKITSSFFPMIKIAE